MQHKAQFQGEMNKNIRKYKKFLQFLLKSEHRVSMLQINKQEIDEYFKQAMPNEVHQTWNEPQD